MGAVRTGHGVCTRRQPVSHTKEYKAPGYDYVRVIVNSDWSGEAELAWKPTGGSAQMASLPGFVLKAIFKIEGRALFEEGLNRLLDRLEEPAS